MAHPLARLQDLTEFRAVGLMSGTSMDGVDAALVRLDADPDHPRVELDEFVTIAYPEELQASLSDAAFGHQLTAEDVATLHTGVAVTFSGAFFEVCRRAGADPTGVDFIGSHGQTVAHVPPSVEGPPVTGTLQLGPPAMIAALTGVTTVGDFRVGDVALGGQGAPLAPCADYLLRRSDERSLVILNIGGIANLTYLPRACTRRQVIAFDTGPGNMVLDELFRVRFPGAGRYDEDGVRAAAGTVSTEMLSELGRHPYFAAGPPKSAGHREFGAQFAWRMQAMAEEHGLGGEDLLATAAALTAGSIGDAIERFVLPSGPVDEVFITGGGAHNAAVVRELGARLGETPLRPIDELGIPADAKEAVDFALLARETLFGRPNVLSSVTGGARDLVLGVVALGGPA